MSHSDISSIRTKDKELRRLVVGRRDRGRKTLGIIDVGLVIANTENLELDTSKKYRLSLHGILYCLDVLDFSKKEIDQMASNYSDILPMIFGKWDYLKSIIGDDVYRIRLLTGGLFLDTVHITKISQTPIFEIITYLNVKYQDYYESIDENDLADQISYLFYAALLVPFTVNENDEENKTEKWKKLFEEDENLNIWFFDFIKETSKFYSNRFDFIKSMIP
ncbi:hypothetical protein [Nitrosopumilus maritimus]|uniref:hypothetical protein n=1 Tax=Nitrosopumilus maritimus TaxID=338192 RepID=UPI001EE52829|nr:hypothetical protein [Nitrosopumilus maritimus]